MSGAVAAHAAYNGSGTQGLAVTNKIHDDDGDVMSVFWNKNDTTRQLLYGSSIIEIPSSGASTLNYGSSRLFTVNNDIDCLGDMYLQLTAALPKYTFPTTFAGSSVVPSHTSGSVETILSLQAKTFSLQTIVERIEIQVGTQIWQTIENHDLRVVNSTELTPDAFSEISILTSPADSGTATHTGWIVIPSLTKTLGPRFGKYTNQTEDGYPMAAAPHQSVKIKVHFREFPTSLSYLATSVSGTAPTIVQFAEDVPLEGKIEPKNLTDSTTPKASEFAATAGAGLTFTASQSSGGAIGACNLYAKQQIMCNEEREQMKAMPMGLPKRLKMTQNAYTTDIGSSTIKTIELDHFSLYASHLIITGNAGQVGSSQIKLRSVELKLNSSSYSGQLPGILLDSCTADSLGLYSNKYIYSSGTADFTVDEYGIGTYLFPLAATAYAGSCVPLNRFDSIRLTLTFTSVPQQGASTFVNVTCVGETTALFKGGAASLAMY